MIKCLYIFSCLSLILIPICFLIPQKTSFSIPSLDAATEAASITTPVPGVPTTDTFNVSIPAAQTDGLTYRTSKFSKVHLGTSGLGRPLIAYEYIHDNLLPTFLIISNIHGNETIGYYIIQHFIDELEEGTSRQPFDGKMNFIIIPSVNPDGFFANTRRTADNHDPNRDYHDDPSLDRSLETKQCKEYFHSISNRYNMCFSVHLHGGALCVSYPMDAHPFKLSKYSKSEHDQYYKKAARTYVQHHTVMEDKYTFNGGYVNGADWYHIAGSMQDWLIGIGIPSITLELSRVKNPVQVNVKSLQLSDDSQKIVDAFWEENRQALIELIWYCLTASIVN